MNQTLTPERLAGFFDHTLLKPYATTVSYTHLDVYKRQVEVLSNPFPRDQLSSAFYSTLATFSRWMENRCVLLTCAFTKITPVSYTHLDVYKRQGLGSTFEELSLLKRVFGEQFILDPSGGNRELKDVAEYVRLSLIHI